MYSFPKKRISKDDTKMIEDSVLKLLLNFNLLTPSNDYIHYVRNLINNAKYVYKNNILYIIYTILLKES